MLSNEPGYYKDGAWGIRESVSVASLSSLTISTGIENLVIVQEATLPNNFGNKGYLRFEHITMAPITPSLVDASLLNSAELAWLNDYNAEVRQKLTPFLGDDDLTMKYLEKETRAIGHTQRGS